MSRGYSLSGAPNNYINLKIHIDICREVKFVKKGKHYTTDEIEQIKELSLTHHDYEIAEIMDRTVKGIGGILDRYGTKRPAASTIRKRKLQQSIEDKYGVPIQWLLRTMHWTLEIPIRNGMDKYLGIASVTVTEWMKEFKIPNRTISEDNHRRYRSMTKEQILAQTTAANKQVRKYGFPDAKGRAGWSRGLTKETHPGLMTTSIKQTGENNPMYDLCGELSPQWKGGKIWWRGKRWDTIKKIVKERDNHTCQHCGITEKEWIKKKGQPLQVHHIVLYRVSKNNNIENLITLCNSCHTKADAKNLRELKKPPEAEKCRQKKLNQFKE